MKQSSSPVPISRGHGETAPESGRAAGVALMLTSSASNQVGAGLGALAFPTIGPVGVVAVRQLITALVLVPAVRPRVTGLSRSQWWPVLGLAVVFGIMNLSLYAAIDRIGLAAAVTIEFLGPLSVAIAGSRRRIDLACAVLAAVGVVVLSHPGTTTDALGIALAALAAALWASYILLNRSLGMKLPGLHGTAIAAGASAGLWLPIAAWWFLTRPPTFTALVLATACGLLSSIVPYAADLAALRRVPTSIFGTFTSANPVWAALSGWILLGHAPAWFEWLGIGLIVVSNIVVTMPRGANHPRRD